MDAFLLLAWALIGAVVFGLFALLVLMPTGGKGRGPLGLEVLGVRITPAAHTWTGLGTTANVSDVGNWNGGPIGVGDSFTFDGSLGAASNKSATWDAAAPGSVSNVTISGAYTGTVGVAVNLAVTTALSQTAAGGQLRVSAGDALGAFSYTLQGSTLNGPGLVYTAQMNVGGGATISGAQVTESGTLQVNGDATLDNAATLLSQQNAAWVAGQINLKNNSSITNVGSWDVTCDQSMVGTPGSTFFNADSFTKNATTGQTKLIVDSRILGNPLSAFGNDDDGHGVHGIVTKFAGGVSTFAVQFGNWGTLAFNGFTMAFTGGLTQSGANSVTNLGGGTLTTTSPFSMTAGQLIAPGTINGSIQMSGALQFSGATGVLTVTGDFTETANSSIQLRIGGNQANQYDQINVGGTASLNGQLHPMLINGFKPAATDRFKVHTAGKARTGTWTVDVGWTPYYNPNDVTLSNP